MERKVVSESFQASSSNRQNKNESLSAIHSIASDSCLAIVDSRACLRESLAASLRQMLGKPVLAMESLADLESSTVRQSQTISTALMALSVIGVESLTEQTHRLKQQNPQLKLVLLVDTDTDVSHHKFLESHLSGIIPTDYRTEQLYLTLCAIESGVRFFPAEGYANISESSPRHADDGDTSIAKLSDLESLLTPRQLEVLLYISQGKSNKFIASELSVCESTVKVHVSEVMRRLGATSRTHASYLVRNLSTTWPAKEGS